MCIHVNNSDFEDYDWADIPQKPFSGYLIHQTLEFRNDTPEISCVASFARKVVGELFFAALAVAAVVAGTAAGLAVGLNQPPPSTPVNINTGLHVR